MATEKRLIDANVLLKLYDMGAEFEEYVKALSVPIPVIRQNIKDMPTVDAVEVVRCKDCRFILDRVDGTHGCYRHFMGDCNHDDFCSYGERKGNG